MLCHHICQRCNQVLLSFAIRLFPLIRAKLDKLFIFLQPDSFHCIYAAHSNNLLYFLIGNNFVSNLDAR